MSTHRYLVKGRVQSVGFRYFVLREADALRLTGWVRNLADGTVEVVASGDDVLLSTLEGRLWQGPPMARVTSLDVSSAEDPAAPGFHIQPTPW